MLKFRHRKRPLCRAVWLAVFVLLLLLTGPACRPAGYEAVGSADSMSLEQAVGQMLLIGFRGVDLDDDTAAMLREIQPGGVLLFDYDGPSKGELPRNITSPAQLQALTAELQDATAISYFIAIDAEGGYVNRLKPKYGFTVTLASAQTLGSQPPANTETQAAAMADVLHEMGINLNLAPVVDVNVDPASPAIGKWERSFSDDPSAVVAHANAFVKAHQERGIITTLKHFPGHGSAAGDTHLGVTDVTATYRADSELAPYRQLIDAGYDGAVMTAHIVNRNLDPGGQPATLSAAIVSGLLRDELGFDGVIISDDMQMGAIVAEYSLESAAVAAVNAGVDVVMLTNQHEEYDVGSVYRVRDAIVEAISKGDVPEERVRESARRILALKRKYDIHPATGN